MKIEILGMGCPKCKKTTQNAQLAIEELGIEAEIVKVEELDKITEYGVMMTPALVIDGEVKVAGKIPSKQEIISWIEVKK
ncbi:MAG TPA: thioredoxin family protein [Atribacterota bacterium]|nr:thioredoxin family protein [Atribacterota bacterium]